MKPIAFYLPQFHAIPENDSAWGEGFTEWTNVRKATPLFPGHRQPIAPAADLGYYNLLDPSVCIYQAELARQNGIFGFAYWHYWFAGHRVLERPVEAMIEGGQPDFPFCLAWANQSWSGVWHGNPQHIILRQTYPGEVDFKQHFEAVLPAFRDPRYITIDGRPMFIIYKPHAIPDIEIFTKLWRKFSKEAGIHPPYLIGIDRYGDKPTPKCLDANMLISPIFSANTIPFRLLGRATNSLSRAWKNRLRLPPNLHSHSRSTRVVIENMGTGKYTYPCVFTSWDNTPRSGRDGQVYIGPSVKKFELQLRAAQLHNAARNREFVFVRSWNEWAEGNVLEPEATLGTAYLDVVRNLIKA